MNIKYQGSFFNNNHVKTKFKDRENLYDEISDFFKIKQKYDTEINIARKNHPKWHDNQILSLFNLKYPNGMISNSIVI